MHVHVLSLFPEAFGSPLSVGPIRRAREVGALHVSLHQLRDYTTDRHGTADDVPYGGGQGMVLKVEPLVRGIEHVTSAVPMQRVLLSARGVPLTQAWATRAATLPALLLVCGRYEGVDERVREHLADDEISIGDYVLSGGEPAAIVLVDAVARHLPGVLGSEQSLEEESHAHGLLEYPQYTRPAEYRGMAVPEILLSGHHAEIARWRREQSVARTAARRPDLLARAELTPSERRGVTQPHSAAPRLFRVILPVTDIEEGARFYAAVLDMPGERVSTGRHYFDCGGTILAAVDPSGEGLEMRPNVEHVYFAVPDLKAAFDRARAAGCSWLEKRIARRAWGERSFYARDPFGNPICFVDEDTVFTGGRFVP